MTTFNIARQRLLNQHIAGTPFEKPADVVQWMGAVQAQDYASAKWALGLRLQGAIDAAIDQALADGTILRTHVMRPTWHFVTPADIRWLLALTAPRINAMNAHYYRRLGLDEATFKRSNAALAKALQGGKQLTRLELVPILQQAGIATENLGFVYIIMHAELDGLVCSGARKGKQFTYALLDERVPQVKTLEREEALAELAMRYFTSHGPATLQDFVWWSGLSVADTRTALAMVTSQLIHEVIDGQTYWTAPSAPPVPSAKDLSQTAYLLPNFDEYTVGYTDRSAVFDPSHTPRLDSRDSILFNHTIILGGQVIGTWKRTIKKDAVIITPNLFTSLNKDEIRAFAAAANRYGAFLGLPVHANTQ